MTKKTTHKTKANTAAKTKSGAKIKTEAKTTTYSESKPLNNWHRKMYALDPTDDDPPEYDAVVNHDAGANNVFWLESAVYTGPAMKVDLIDVVPNSLCFRVGFVGQDMLDLWRTCEFFAAGTEDLTFDDDGNPVADENTQRLQSKVQLDDGAAIISLCLDPKQAGKVWVNVALGVG